MDSFGCALNIDIFLEISPHNPWELLSTSEFPQMILIPPDRHGLSWIIVDRRG